MSTRIDIAGLTKTFPSPGGGIATAVDRVDLTIEPGELFFLLGPSGCGKTTLLRMVAGFIDPDSGSISFDGADITRTAPNKRNTGMVFQSYALWPHMTVEANVAFGLKVRNIAPAERARRVKQALDTVQMGEYAKRKPTQLSGGQQQRVALARALVVEPAVLLLDEPLSNLDAKLRLELRAEIRRICKATGMTSIYVTHDQKEALSMADRIAIMRRGRAEQVGPPKEMYQKPRTEFVASFLGETNFIAGTVKSVDDTHAVVESKSGVIRALRSNCAGEVATGSRVTCSIRPEHVRYSNGEDVNTFAAAGGHETFLGEITQLDATLTSGESVRAMFMGLPDRSGEGEGYRLAVDPADVVVIPASS